MAKLTTWKLPFAPTKNCSICHVDPSDLYCDEEGRYDGHDTFGPTNTDSNWYPV